MQKNDVTQRGMQLQKTGQKGAIVLPLKMEKGGHEPRNVGSLFEGGKDKENNSPIELLASKAAPPPP